MRKPEIDNSVTRMQDETTDNFKLRPEQVDEQHTEREKSAAKDVEGTPKIALNSNRDFDAKAQTEYRRREEDPVEVETDRNRPKTNQNKQDAGLVEESPEQKREKIPAQKKNRGFKLAIPQNTGLERDQLPPQAKSQQHPAGSGKGFMDFFSPRGGKQNPSVVPMVVEETPVKIEPFLHGLKKEEEEGLEEEPEFF